MIKCLHGFSLTHAANDVRNSNIIHEMIFGLLPVGPIACRNPQNGEFIWKHDRRSPGS